MRMWGVDTKLMCNKHLLGEHVEMHMFDGCINKGKSIQGYINKGLVEVYMIRYRHIDLAHEMKRRNMKHNSPLDFHYIASLGKQGKIDIQANLKELARRCPECNKKINQGVAK